MSVVSCCGASPTDCSSSLGVSGDAVFPLQHVLMHPLKYLFHTPHTIFSLTVFYPQMCLGSTFRGESLVKTGAAWRDGLTAQGIPKIDITRSQCNAEVQLFLQHPRVIVLLTLLGLLTLRTMQE